MVCSEILSLATTFSETPKRKFDNNKYWGVFYLVTTKLGKETSTPDDNNDTNTLSKFATSIFDHSKQSNTDQIVDYSLLDDNVMSTLNEYVANSGEGKGYGDNNEDDVVNSEDSDKVEIDVVNGIGTNSTKAIFLIYTMLLL